MHVHKQSHGERDIQMEGAYSNEFYDDAPSLLHPTCIARSFRSCGTAMEFFWGWISNLFNLSNLFGQRKDTDSPCSTIRIKIGLASAKLDPALSSKSSTCIQIKTLMQQTPGEFDVEPEIEKSRVHWSEAVQCPGAEANREVFESLKKRWGSFFVDRGHLWEIREKIAEGGQAEIFNAARAYPTSSDGKIKEGYVLKVFKTGTALKYLQHHFPHGMLHSSDYSGFGLRHYAIKNVLGGILLKDGRFAFEMWGDWGDLRKLIDLRMEQNGNQYPLFTDEEVGLILLDIAKGMEELHKNKIVHRDLKAPNVLVVRYKDNRGTTFFPADDNFHCAVADYECSAGVVGTGFYRAPEILRALKNREKNRGIVKPYLFSKQADVYSYGMTCYEVLTGKIPFAEELRMTDYDVVIDGRRPDLPNHIQPVFKTLLTRCWLSDPSQRPSFEEIVNILQKSGIRR